MNVCQHILTFLLNLFHKYGILFVRKAVANLLDLYKNIKTRREELEMSQDELAQKTGYTSRSSIAKIEKGLVDLTQTKISLFAHALKTTSSDLMGWTETEEDKQGYYLNNESRDAAQFLFENPKYKVLFDATRKVKPEDIDFVKQMIDKMNGNN